MRPAARARNAFVMQRTRRLSLRALAVIALAALAPIVPAKADEQPPQPLDPWAGLTYAVRARAAAEAHWYVTVSEANERAVTPRADRSRHAGAPARLDGDRFDRLAACESGGDATANTGNGYLGAFQWLLSTWHAAGGTGSPVEHSYAEQKAVAMRWAARTNPAGQWPVCWPRSG